MTNEKGSAKNVIDSYRKRQQSGPFIVGALAVVVAIVGILLLILWLTGPNRPAITLFATSTPTPTETPTPTLTPVPTDTPTPTPTPTETLTPTPSAPFTYIVQEGDTLATITEKFSLGDNGIPLLLLLNPAIDPATQIIFVSQEILVPHPGLELPTATPLPTGLPRGTKIEYIVQANDTLATIAAKFNSTVEDIMKENEIENANFIFVGQVLVIRVNLVTPVPTSTPAPPTVTPTRTP